MPIVRNCLVCKKEFFTYPSQIKKKNHGLFCSRKCASLGEYNPRYNGGLEKICKICMYCGKKFYVTKRISKLRPAKYCSVGCKNKYNIKFNSKYYRYLSIDNKRVAEHRYIIESKLGRKLSSDEVVHHINGNVRDNSLHNLVVLKNSEHSKLHRKLNGRY